MRKLNWQYTLQWADGEKLNDLFLNLPTAASQWFCCKRRQCRISLFYCCLIWVWIFNNPEGKVICWANTRPPRCPSILKQTASILWTVSNNVTCVVLQDWHLLICCWRDFWVSWVESRWDKIWQKLELKYFFYYLEKTLQKVNKLLERWPGPSSPVVYEHMSLKFRKKCSESASYQWGRVMD